MSYTKGILIGRITKVHGYAGAVTIRTEKPFSEKIPEIESVFLEIEGKPVPFLIEYSEPEGHDVLRMKFVGYDIESKIREFVNCRVFLTSNSSAGSVYDDLQNILEFTVISEKGLKIGSIREVINNNGQILLSVQSDSAKEILIPLHEDLIKEISIDQKIIIMILPEGLTEIN